MVLMLWVCFATPLIICFGVGGQWWELHWMGLIELWVDLSFAEDIYVNFRSIYYDAHGTLVSAALTACISWCDVGCVLHRCLLRMVLCMTSSSPAA